MKDVIGDPYGQWDYFVIYFGGEKEKKTEHILFFHNIPDGSHPDIKTLIALSLLILVLQKYSGLKRKSMIQLLHIEIMKNQPYFGRFWGLSKGSNVRATCLLSCPFYRRLWFLCHTLQSAHAEAAVGGSVVLLLLVYHTCDTPATFSASFATEIGFPTEKLWWMVTVCHGHW